MKAKHVIKINLPGGFVSAGDLYEMLVIAADAGAREVRFGNRQQLFFSIAAGALHDLETDMIGAGIHYEVGDDVYPNIISSYVCDAIFNQDSWLKEGVYKDIFDLFNYQPKLKINLVDRHQSFVPFFSGNLNFISSDVSNYWYLYIRFPKTNQFYCWPSLIYSDDIPAFSRAAETVMLKNKGLFCDVPNIDQQLYFDMVSKLIDLPGQPAHAVLQLPDFQLPYYEGFNRYANNKYWLGIYRRNECFDIDFLKDVCDLCLSTRIGQIYTTPWKSILIKGINPAERQAWGLILDRYRLNVRHASNELNWQIEDLCPEGLELKQELVRLFELADLRTFRLSFAIKTRAKTGIPGSIVIKTQPSGTFEILHTYNFNPNSKDYISYKRRVKRPDLASQLITLCDHYYNLVMAKSRQTKAQPLVAETAPAPLPVYQCRHCQTVYDQTYGDELQHIPPGTLFDALPATYTCAVCEAGKDSFELLLKDGILSHG